VYPRLDTVLGVGLLVCLAAAAAYVCLHALGLIRPSQVLPGTLLTSWLAPLDPLAKLAVAGGALVVGLLSCWAILARLSPARPLRSDSPLVLEHDERGIVVVDGECIVRVAEHAAVTTPGVWDAEVIVRPRGNGVVDLKLVCSMLEGTDVRRGATRARDRAIEAIDKLLGLEVGHTRVRVRLVELGEIERGRA
jgi:hypothetical protein